MEGKLDFHQNCIGMWAGAYSIRLGVLLVYLNIIITASYLIIINMRRILVALPHEVSEIWRSCGGLLTLGVSVRRIRRFNKDSDNEEDEEEDKDEE